MHPIVQMNAEIQRIPVHLWDSLQAICFRQDMKFLQDVSRLIGVPTHELKKKVFGSRGIPTTVITESSPWWTSMQCPVMVLHGCIWRRCSGTIETQGTCLKHRHATHFKRFDDPYFTSMQHLKPIKSLDTIYWADDEGNLVSADGIPIKDKHLDIKRGILQLGPRKV